MIRKKILNSLRRMDDLIHSIGPIRILFVVKNQLGMACLLPIIEKTQIDNEFQIAITLESLECYSPANETSPLFDKYYIPSNKAVNKKWHYVFTTEQTGLWFKRNTTVIYTQHGNAYGNLDKSLSNKFNYIKELVLKDSHDIYFANAFGDSDEIQSWISMLPKNVIKHCYITGLPRSDKLALSTQSDSDNFLKSIGLDHTKKTLVINSHWTEKSLFRSLNTHFIDDICQHYPKLNVLVLGHGRLWQDTGSLLLENTYKVAKNNTNCRFFPNFTDSTNLLRSADIFIGDNSSIFIEYCMVNKPIIFFNNKDFVFSDEQVGKLYKEASTPFSKPTEIVSIINDVLTSTDKLSNQRLKVTQHFLSNVGQATDNVINKIKQLSK